MHELDEMVSVEVIEIAWEGPLEVDEVIKTKNGAEDYGLYQIYGTHNVLGSDTLLYIGKAVAGDRPFSVRISEHRNEWMEWEPSEIKVYLGKLGGVDRMSEERWREWEDKIDWAERLLIYYCSPPYNSKGLKTFGNIPHPVILLNFRQKNRLPLEVSTLYESTQISTGGWKAYGT